MRTFLLLILIAVIAVLFWAVWTQTFVNSGVFVLGLISTGLCGYLIADYFFNNIKSKWLADIDLYKKEVTGLKEENDILQKQVGSAITPSELDEVKGQLQQAETEKRRLNGEFLAQAATISQLNTRLDKMQSEYNEIQEDSTVNTESRLTEIEAIRDTLAITKAKLSELAAENESLRNELNRFKNVSDKVGNMADDLKLIEGIGVKIEALLHEQGILTWKDLSKTSVDNLRDILHIAGERYEIHDPTTWPEQARLLMNNDWETFNEYIHDLRLAKADDNGDKILKTEQTSIQSIDNQEVTPSVEKPAKAMKTEKNKVEKTETSKSVEVENTENIKSDTDNILNQNIESKPEIDIKKVENKIAVEAEKDPELLALLDDLDQVEGDLPVHVAPVKPVLTASTAVENTVSTNDSIGELPTKEAIQAYAAPAFMGTPDDLKVIGGIGPKIESLLKDAGIMNWQQLSECSVERLRSILDKAGSRYRLNDPTTWAEQARLLQTGDLEKFKLLNVQVYMSK